MITVNITAPNASAVAAKLQKLGEKAFIFDAAMDEIGKETTAYLAGQAFASQGGVFDEVWESLSTGYALYKSKHFPGAGPEIRTGAMQKGYYYTSTSTQAVISNRKAEGENPYFIYQQEGTSRGLPPRKLIAVNQDIKTIINDIIGKDINDKIAQAGL